MNTNNPHSDTEQITPLKAISGQTVLPQKKITGSQMKQVLKMCGKNCVKFAQFLVVSDNYVRQTLGYSIEPIPFTYYDALKVFVGEENFLCSLRELNITP